MRFVLIVFSFIIYQSVFSQSTELPFKVGEKFEYNIFFEFIKSGSGTLLLKKIQLVFLRIG